VGLVVGISMKDLSAAINFDGVLRVSDLVATGLTDFQVVSPNHSGRAAVGTSVASAKSTVVLWAAAALLA